MRAFVLVAAVSAVVLTGLGQTLVWTNFQAGAELGAAENWNPNQTPGFSTVLQLGSSLTGAPRAQESRLSSGDVSALRLYVGWNTGFTGVVHMTGGKLTVNGDCYVGDKGAGDFSLGVDGDVVGGFALWERRRNRDSGDPRMVRG